MIYLYIVGNRHVVSGSVHTCARARLFCQLAKPSITIDVVYRSCYDVQVKVPAFCGPSTCIIVSCTRGNISYGQSVFLKPFWDGTRAEFRYNLRDLSPRHRPCSIPIVDLYNTHVHIVLAIFSGSLG